jgi:RsiW-degrading membrane proteinase PrsW (M82 family)
MSVLVTLIIAFLPGLAWLAYIRYQDRAAPEPRHLVGLVFFLGMLATLPASFGNVILERGVNFIFPPLVRGLGMQSASPQSLEVLFHFLFFFLVVGPVEELSKFLVVRLSVYYHREFDEPIDALVYCAAAALGFASLENVIYALQKGTSVLYIRALLSVPGHLLFSAIWGFGMARAKFAGKSFWPGLLLAALLHGFYDFVLVAFSEFDSVLGLPGGRVGLLFVLPLMGIMAWMLQRRIMALQRTSGPFLERRRQQDGSLPVTLSTLPPLPKDQVVALRAAAQKFTAQRAENAQPAPQVAPRPVAPAPQEAQAAPAPGGVAWAWCGSCKAPVQSSDRFCRKCGGALSFAPKNDEKK